MKVLAVKVSAAMVAAVAAIGLAVAGATTGIAVAEPPPSPEPAPVAGTPLPTPEELSGMLTRLTDAGVTYKEKGYLVENGIDQSEGHGLDHDLRKAYRDGELPYTFTVLSVVPTTPGQAIATVTTSGPKTPAQTAPMTLVDQGTWVISQQSAQALFHQLAPH